VLILQALAVSPSLTRKKEDGKVAVKILTRLTVPIDNARELLNYSRELRVMAMAHSGYICGETETLESLDQPDVYVVISNWRSVEDWENWLKNKERQEIQSKIDSLLGEKTTFEKFRSGFCS
jgi:heme-degrading monooxygenase HmoA